MYVVICIDFKYKFIYLFYLFINKPCQFHFQYQLTMDGFVSIPLKIV